MARQAERHTGLASQWQQQQMRYRLSQGAFARTRTQSRTRAAVSPRALRPTLSVRRGALEAAQQRLAFVEESRRVREREKATRALWQATQALDTIQRSRVLRILKSWEDNRVVGETLSRSRPAEPESRRRRSPAHEFSHYLINAHLHPVIAGGGDDQGQRWFEQWRRTVLDALKRGIVSTDVAAILRSAPRWCETGARAASARSGPLRADCLRERLAHTLFPNAPTASRRHRRPVCGGGRLVGFL